MGYNNQIIVKILLHNCVVNELSLVCDLVHNWIFICA